MGGSAGSHGKQRGISRLRVPVFHHIPAADGGRGRSSTWALSDLRAGGSPNLKYKNTPPPHPPGRPDRQTLLAMAPRHERTESSLSVSASSAPHSLFLDQTDGHDYPPLTHPRTAAPPALNLPTLIELSGQTRESCTPILHSHFRANLFPAHFSNCR